MKRWPSTKESLVFESSGWLSPQLASKSANKSKNTLQPPRVNMSVSGLEPHTEYAFRVLAVNMAGRALSSAWASERTGESGKDQCFAFLLKTPRWKCCLEIKVKETFEVERADDLAMNSFVGKKA